MKITGFRGFTNTFLTISALIFGLTTMANAGVNPALVSKAPNGDNGTADSRNVSVSADGRYVAFESDATNLVPGLTDNNNFSDIYLRDTRLGTLRCISIANATTTGNALSANPVISADGRYVIFVSKASDLVTGVTDTNFDYDLFRFDTVTNQTQLVSINVAGTTAGNLQSGYSDLYTRMYDLSDDGRYVAFVSLASNLNGLSDTNNKTDIFVRDMQSNVTTLVSVNSNGDGTGNDFSIHPSISGDGNAIAFASPAGNLIAGDNNNTTDVFIYNQQQQTTHCASKSVGGVFLTGRLPSEAPIISKNGARVAYFSDSNDLSATPIPPTNPFQNVYVHDITFNSTALVSINTTNSASGNEDSGNGIPHQLNLSISANGRYIAFESKAANLVDATSTPAAGRYNVFRRDVTLGKTELVSYGAANVSNADAPSFLGFKNNGMSDDGRLITFISTANDAAPDLPGNSQQQIYVRDMTNKITTALTMNSAGTAFSTGSKDLPSLSANGRSVVFSSVSMDILPVNAHNTQNVFKSFVPTPQRAGFDFDGDGRTDFPVFRAAQGAWYVLNSDATFASVRLYGNSTDIIAPADYTGDGRTDYAIFRPSSGTWYISDGLTFAETIVQFGAAGDKPVPSDYDGDGKADIAVYRNGTWWWLSSDTGQMSAYQLGTASDVPVHGDFDSDGKADYAVFRPSNGTWHIRKSSNGQITIVQFGVNGDKAVPADYDGDGKADIAVFRGGVWYIYRSTDGAVSVTQFGVGTDIPSVGSYDGDGKADIAVWRPADGRWYVLRSSNGTFSAVHFGQNGDTPVPAAYVR